MTATADLSVGSSDTARSDAPASFWWATIIPRFARDGRSASGGAFARGFAGQHFAGTRGHLHHDRRFGRRDYGSYDYGCYGYPYYNPYSCYLPAY